MTCEWLNVEMPLALALSISPVWDSYGHGIQELGKVQGRMDAPSAALQLPRCASAALLTRLGGGSEGVFAFSDFVWFVVFFVF